MIPLVAQEPMSYRSPRFSSTDEVTQPTTSPPVRLRPAVRLTLIGAATVGLALVITARRLEPDPRGYGTHEQLGLTPCFFHQWTGHVCPACGTTTAWAHMLRGELRQAASANLGGTLLCVFTLIAVPWLLATGIAGRWLAFHPTWTALLLAGTTWLAVALLDWLRRWLLG